MSGLLDHLEELAGFTGPGSTLKEFNRIANHKRKPNTTSEVAEKHCGTCRKWKPEDEFKMVTVISGGAPIRRRKERCIVCEKGLHNGHRQASNLRGAF